MRCRTQSIPFLAVFAMSAAAWAAGPQKAQRSSNDCGHLISQLEISSQPSGQDFETLVSQKIPATIAAEQSAAFSEFYSWALDVPAGSIPPRAAASVAAMLRVSDSDFVNYFEYLGLSKIEFSVRAQAFVDGMAELANAARPKPQPRSPYRTKRPDQYTVEGLLGNLPDLITKSRKEEIIRWKADSQTAYPIVDEISEPLLQRIAINGREIEVNEIRTYVEKEDYSNSAMGPDKFLEVLSRDGEDLLHFRYHYLSIADQIDGHDSISNNAILKEVWIKDPSGAWLEVTEHVSRTKIKYFYKSLHSMRAGDIEVIFVPLKDL